MWTVEVDVVGVRKDSGIARCSCHVEDKVVTLVYTLCVPPVASSEKGVRDAEEASCGCDKAQSLKHVCAQYLGVCWCDVFRQFLDVRPVRRMVRFREEEIDDLAELVMVSRGECLKRLVDLQQRC